MDACICMLNMWMCLYVASKRTHGWMMLVLVLAMIVIVCTRFQYMEIKGIK